MIKKTDHLEKIVPGVLNSFCQVAGSGSHPVQIHYKKRNIPTSLVDHFMLDPLLCSKPTEVNKCFK